MGSVRVDVLDAKSGRKLVTVDRLDPTTPVSSLKHLIQRQIPKLYPSRQSLRLEPRGRVLADEEVLQDLPLGSDGTLYLRDLGPQVAWTTVFLTEYAGPLLIYLVLYLRPALIYGASPRSSSPHLVVHLACLCHSLHFAKRLLETVFVHRFSHGTMPLRNIFKNCFYYWGFAAYLAYYINHPLYSPPMYREKQVFLGFITFLICELGNFSIHLALRDLRPAGSKARKIPYPTRNPFTWLFKLVSCPNYTYEVGAWLSFTIMTQTLAGALFTLVGFLQMSVWALGKHRSYKRDFSPQYPRVRTAILPFLL
ncbi:very-long-chain enoyl-CoA reductase-like [Lampetra fluviatilis]